MGTVTLTAGDLDALAGFYSRAIGLEEQRRDGDVVERSEPSIGNSVTKA